jgi:tRNA-dihydrouridine synthase
MMGVTDGAFCGHRSGGCAMFQLGAYLAEPTATAQEKGSDADSFLPVDPQACSDFLSMECSQARGSGDVLTCVNLATPRLEWGLEAAQRFAQAGGDLVELNAHGGYGRYLKQGLLRAMVLPENQGELYRWVEGFASLDIPLIVKFNGQSGRGLLLQALEGMARWDVFGVHVNVRDEAARKPDAGLVRALAGHCPGALLVSGYVRSAEDAEALFEAGAHAVGIAAPTRRDAAYIAKIAAAYAQAG